MSERDLINNQRPKESGNNYDCMALLHVDKDTAEPWGSMQRILLVCGGYTN